MSNTAKLSAQLKKENLPQSLAKKLIKNLIATSCSQRIYFELNFKNNNFDFSTEKQNYYYSEIFISSDFRSIWLPPKIS